MDRVLSQRWRAVFQKVKGAPATWRSQMTSSLQRAAETDAAVFTCKRARPESATFDASGTRMQTIAPVLLQRFIPALEETGSGWRSLIERHGTVYPSVDVIDQARLVDMVRNQVLAPQGLNGMLTAMLQDQEGQLLGWISIGGSRSNRALLREFRAPLADLSAAVSERISHALTLAEQFGARWPKPPSRLLAKLSQRELEIARLAARGYSDLNIAAKLNVSEATIGSHMYRIYRHLCVHSRLELAAQLGED